ncbi:unnamed protein product [Blepharisma stoltei]|uniref:Uncharacterized protein n=1 Tax=Blepharisma stoltei TaxID=1481888 RepID=A0AAU9K893_9CILI|nr:unnamed protein product [Blepharisma stoltei]
MRFTSIGKKIIAINSLAFGFGALENYLYYDFLPSLIKQNFKSTTLLDKPEYADQVLIVLDDHKFVFNHRGGSQAAESVIIDTFTNNKMMRRAIALQWICTVTCSIGFLKHRKRFGLFAGASILGCGLFLCPILMSGFRLYFLSELVSENNEEVWENLNEARFAQRMEEFTSLWFLGPRFAGLGLVAISTAYFTPFLGFLLGMLTLATNIHMKNF